MPKPRTFSTAAVVSAVTGFLLCPIGDVYEVLSFLTGRSVYTHELGAAGKMCLPHVVEQIPSMAEVNVSGVTRENWQEKLAAIEAQLGKELTLTPIGWNALADKNPMETLVEMVGEDRVIALGEEDV